MTFCDSSAGNVKLLNCAHCTLHTQVQTETRTDRCKIRNSYLEESIRFVKKLHHYCICFEKKYGKTTQTSKSGPALGLAGLACS